MTFHLLICWLQCQCIIFVSGSDRHTTKELMMWRSEARFQYARLLFNESREVSPRRHRGLIMDALSVCDRLWDVIKHALCPLPNWLSLFLSVHVSLYLPLPLAVSLCCVMVFIWQLCHCLLPVVLNGILHLHQRESLMWSVEAQAVSDCVQKKKSGKEKWPDVTLCSLSVNRRRRWCPSSLHSKCICHFLFYLKTFQANLSSFTAGWRVMSLWLVTVSRTAVGSVSLWWRPVRFSRSLVMSLSSEILFAVCLWRRISRDFD